MTGERYSREAVDLLADLRRNGIELLAEGDRLRYRPRSALSPQMREVLERLKPEMLALLSREWGPVSDSTLRYHLICPVCGAYEWTYSIRGCGVFCGGCSTPVELGLGPDEHRPASYEELLRVAVDYGYRPEGDSVLQDRYEENEEYEETTRA